VTAYITAGDCILFKYSL